MYKWILIFLIVLTLPGIALAQLNQAGAGGGTSDSIGVDTNGDGSVNAYLYPATLKKGANVTFTVNGDILTIAGPAGGGTADSMGIDSNGDGSINAYLYSITAGAFHIKKGDNLTLTVAGDTVTIAAVNVVVSDSTAADVDTTGTEIAAALGNKMYNVGDTVAGTYNFSGNPLEFIRMIDFDDTITAPSHSEGRFFYDKIDNCFAAYNNEADITLNIGQEGWVYARNITGSTILDGKVVYIIGAISSRPTIALAQADAEATSKLIGVATHDIETASNGYVTVWGVVRGINLSDFSDGDDVFLSAAVAGSLTTTAPSAPNYVVEVGYVIDASANGDLLVSTGKSKMLNSLGDVLVSGPATGNVLVYDGNVWADSESVPAADSAGKALLAQQDADGDSIDISLLAPITSPTFNGAAVFNEQGNAVDFRVEGDTSQYLFEVNGSKSDTGEVNISGGLNINLPADDNITIDGRTFPREVTIGSMRWNHTPETNTIGTRALFLDVDANSVPSTEGLHIGFKATLLGAGEEGIAIDIEGNTSNSTGGEIVALSVTKVGIGSAKVYALNVGVGVDNVIIQESGVFGTVDYASDSTGGVHTDFTAAFNSSAIDSTMFDNDNDVIYIGEGLKFEAIDVVLNTIASGAGIAPVFEFSIAGPGWTVFNPIDNTAGFREDGEISWFVDDLTSWASITVNSQTNYWIRITRTRNSLSTPPIEDRIRTAASVEYTWNSTGDLNINSIVFEGATADAFEHTINTIDPTADRAFNFPDDQLVAGDILVASDASDLEYLNLATTQILIGDGSGIPTAAALSVDVTMDNTGAVTVVDDSHNHVITNIDSFSKANLETQTSDVADYAEADGDIWTGVHDFGGATSLEIPNSDNPTTDANGEIAADNNSNALEVYIPLESESGLISFYKQLSIPIVLPDSVQAYVPDLKVWQVNALVHPFGIEIDSVSIQLDADAAYSMVFEEWSGADPPVKQNDISTVTTGGADTYAAEAPDTDAAIDAGDWIVLNIPTTDVPVVTVGIIYHVTEGN